jgi:sister-chromatid-cohesion protein PDS5
VSLFRWGERLYEVGFFLSSAQVKARLRLYAATSLLKLSTIPMYSRLIVPKFPQLALMIQDTSFQVRYRFLTKLLGYLAQRKVDTRYSMVLFMTALDPEEEIKAKVLSSWTKRFGVLANISSGFKLRQDLYGTLPSRQVVAINRFHLTLSHEVSVEARLAWFEMPLPRLLHLIAVHPDFSIDDSESLKDISEWVRLHDFHWVRIVAEHRRSYLDLYMDTVLNSENIHLLTLLTQKVKSVRIPDSLALSQVR